MSWPTESTDALAADPQLDTAFRALTPGRQRGRVLQFAGAKMSATRRSRITKAAPKIRAGRGPDDR